jgi:LuxR family maltose regulon positive regulatory protein
VPLACGGVAEAFLLEAIARDALGDATAAGRALEHVLDLAEQDGGLLLFLLHPARALLERHRKSRTAHPVLIGRILNLLAQGKPAEPAGQRTLRRPEENGATGRAAMRGGSLARMIPVDGNTAPCRDKALPLTVAMEPLTESEIRILRYLQTHLTAHEIARQLHLSVHTVTTHTRHLYAKLGVHRRNEAVDHARALGLLAPYSRTA